MAGPPSDVLKYGPTGDKITNSNALFRSLSPDVT